jgi:NTE family protein
MQEKALVLGGGGVTGVAWEIGLLAGLAERGVNLADADLVVGTSAGSVVGAQLTSGTSVSELYRAQLTPPSAEVMARLGTMVIARYLWAMSISRDPARARARIGRMAMAAKTMPEAERRKVMATIVAAKWPDTRLLITAVDAESGELEAFDAASGVSLQDAVGASCAVPGVWPPVTIGGRRFMDGGMRSPANADLASGYRRVVVIAPLTRGFGHMTSVASQVAGMGSGTRTLVVEPDQAAVRAIGRNVLDPARRAPAARAGYAQATTEAGRIATVWSADPPDRGASHDRGAPGTFGTPVS